MGYIAFFENFIQIVVLLFAWVMVLLAFFILAIQLFVTLIEFKLTTLAGFVLIPFGLFGKTAFLAERVLGNVVSSGIKVLVLAVIVGIGSTLFAEFTHGFGGNQPTIDDAMAIVLAALSLLGLGIFGPGHRQWPGLRRTAARRGRRRRHGLAAGGAVVAGGAAAGMAARRSRRSAGAPPARGARRRGPRRRRGDILQLRVGRTSGMAGIASGLGGVARAGAACSRAVDEARGVEAGETMAESYRGGARAAVGSDGRHVDHGHDRRQCGERWLAPRPRRPPGRSRMKRHQTMNHGASRRCPRRPVRRQPRWRRLRLPPSG